METIMNDKYKKMASTPFGIDAFVICFIYAHKLPLFFSFVKPFLYLLQLPEKIILNAKGSESLPTHYFFT